MRSWRCSAHPNRRARLDHGARTARSTHAGSGPTLCACPRLSGRPRGWVLPAVAGVASVAFGAGVGELAAAVARPGVEPVRRRRRRCSSTSRRRGRRMPRSRCSAPATRSRCSSASALVLVAVAGAAGVLEARRPPLGRVVIALLGVVGAIAASTRANAADARDRAVGRSRRSQRDGAALARAAAARGGRAGAGAVLAAGCRAARMRHPSAGTEPPGHRRQPGVDRRRFLGWAGGAAALGVARRDRRVRPAGGHPGGHGGARGASCCRSRRRRATRARRRRTRHRRPRAGHHAERRVLPHRHRPRRAGGRPVELEPAHPRPGRARGHAHLGRAARPPPRGERHDARVRLERGRRRAHRQRACGSAIPIRELLARAAPTADADMVLSRSIDGFTASTPLEVLQDDRNAILAVGMNGEPLPAEHGFPVRMVVPGLYGYVSATKWVVELEVTRFDAATAYWTDRGWSERGPIKLSSRIDVPRSGQSLTAGPVTVAGVAWHQHVGHRGASRCRSTTARGEPATLATAISDRHLGAVALRLGCRRRAPTPCACARSAPTARCRPPKRAGRRARRRDGPARAQRRGQLTAPPHRGRPTGRLAPRRQDPPRSTGPA